MERFVLGSSHQSLQGAADRTPVDEELFTFQRISKTLEMGTVQGSYSQTEVTAEFIRLGHVEASTPHRITPLLSQSSSEQPIPLQST